MTSLRIRRTLPHAAGAFLLALLGCSPAFGAADHPASDELLRQLRQAVRQELQATNLASNARARLSRLAEQLDRRSTATGDPAAASGAENTGPDTRPDADGNGPPLDSIIAELQDAGPSGATLALCVSLERAIRDEEIGQDNALATDIEAIVDHTGRDLLVAKTSAAVDPLLTRLAQARERISRLEDQSGWTARRILSPRLSKALDRLETMNRAAQWWQAGLVILEAGRPAEAIGPFADAVQSLDGFTTPSREAATNRMLALLNAGGLPDPELVIRQAGAAANRALDTGNSADLDAALATMADVSGIMSRFLSLPRFQASLSRLREARSQLQSLQEVLAARAAGQTARAQELLRSLLGAAEPVAVVPRSRLLSLSYEWQGPQRPPPAPPRTEAAPAPPPPALGDVQRLDEIEPALARREADPGKPRGLPDMRLESELRAILQFRNKFRSSGVLGRMSSLNESQSTALRLELFREIAPAALSDMKANPPAADESTQSYARRLLNTATARTNWAQAARVVDAFQRFGVAEAILDTNDQQALVLFSTGLRRERAGEFALASHSFQRVLSMESQAIPPELVGEHLAAIRRAHPKDYELGVAWTVNPPIPEWVLLRQGPANRMPSSTNATGSATNAPPVPAK